MAIVVGVDGPSLGGFTAVGEVIRADRWRLGQLRAGDSVRMSVVAPRVAAALHAASELELTGRGRAAAAGPAAPGARVEFDRPLDGAHGTVTFRRAGECAALVEFGEPSIDLRSRVRAGQLQRALADAAVAGVIDLTPGVRSLHVQHDPDLISAGSLLDVLKRLESELPPPDRAPVDGRVVRMPLAWREREAMRAIVRYQESVRADAPWCPDNVDFIRRVNGLPDEDSLLEIVYGASYLVLGLGDVYLGAPVAVPLDPRHRLVTTKYTPARTWTPANAVGIGGAFMCVYGVEGPGGYQLVGRTAQIWCSAEQPPWRLRHFDQLQFVPVSEAELYEIRADPGWRPDVRESPFDLAAHERFLLAHASSIAAWTARREAAFARERSAWAAAAEVAA
jgi:urea carboxylase